MVVRALLGDASTKAQAPSRSGTSYLWARPPPTASNNTACGIKIDTLALCLVGLQQLEYPSRPVRRQGDADDQQEEVG